MAHNEVLGQCSYQGNQPTKKIPHALGRSVPHPTTSETYSAINHCGCPFAIAATRPFPTKRRRQPIKYHGIGVLKKAHPLDPVPGPRVQQSRLVQQRVNIAMAMGFLRQLIGARHRQVGVCVAETGNLLLL